MSGPSLFSVLIARGGVRKGARVGTFIVMWATTASSLGREPQMVEVIADWAETDRTMWRYLAEFRELLPELGEGATPEVLGLAERIESRRRAPRRNMVDVSLLAGVPAPAALA